MQRAHGRAVSVQDAVGSAGRELDLEPEAFFGVSCEGAGDESRGSCAPRNLFNRNVLPLAAVLEWKPTSPTSSWQEANLKASEPDGTSLIPLPPYFTAFQYLDWSLGDHTRIDTSLNTRGLERNVYPCPAQIAPWNITRRGSKASSGSIMSW